MTEDDIRQTAARFAAAGRRNIPVPISEWREMQLARIGKATIKTDEKGKQTIKPVDKRSVSAKIGGKKKADRAEKRLRANKEAKR